MATKRGNPDTSDTLALRAALLDEAKAHAAKVSETLPPGHSLTANYGYKGIAFTLRVRPYSDKPPTNAIETGSGS